MSTLTHELDWQAGAACAGVSRDIFFPEEGELVNPAAKRMCHRCPVREVCLDWALVHREVGIWGGLTDSEREVIQRRRHRVRCPDCRSDSVVEEGHHGICLSCGLSWPI